MKTKLEHIIKKYFIEIADIEFFTLNSGHINSTYQVAFTSESQHKKVVLQQLNTNIFEQPEKIATNIHLVNAHLAQSDYRLQLLVPFTTLTGQNYHIEGDDYWRVLHFIPNSYTLEKCENTTQAFAAGQGFGHFLAKLSDFNSPDFQTIIPNFHNAEHRWKQFLAAMKSASPERFAKAQTEIVFAMEQAFLIEDYKKIIEKNALACHSQRHQNIQPFI